MSSNLLSTYDDPQSRKLEGFLGDPMSYKPFDTMIVKDSAHNALQREFPICKLIWDLLRTSVTACKIDKNTFSAPFGIFYVKNANLKRNFSKKVL